MTDYQRLKLSNAIGNIVPYLDWFNRTELDFSVDYDKRTDTTCDATITIKYRGRNDL